MPFSKSWAYRPCPDRRGWPSAAPCQFKGPAAPEFDELAAAAGWGSHKNGVTAPAQRAQLRAELDGLIAHVYGLTEAEFTHILSAFPVVDQAVKAAALAEYRRLGV